MSSINASVYVSIWWRLIGEAHIRGYPRIHIHTFSRIVELRADIAQDHYLHQRSVKVVLELMHHVDFGGFLLVFVEWVPANRHHHRLDLEVSMLEIGPVVKHDFFPVAPFHYTLACLISRHDFAPAEINASIEGVERAHGYVCSGDTQFCRTPAKAAHDIRRIVDRIRRAYCFWNDRFWPHFGC